MEHEILGLDGIKHLLSLVYYTPSIKDEQPPGVLLVAPPGIGKSFILEHFTASNCEVVNDLTGFGLEKIILEVQNKEAGYVVIPDLLRATPRPNSFKSFALLTNVLLQEGLKRVERGNLSFKSWKPVRCGIIAALTIEGFQKHYKFFESTGFLSRHIVLSFSYTRNCLNKISTLVAKGTKFRYHLLQVPKIQTEIEVPDDITMYIEKLGNYLAHTRKDNNPIRAITQIRRLAKAEALLGNSNKVNADHLNRVFTLIPFFRVPVMKENKSGKDFFYEEYMQGATDAMYYILKGYTEHKDTSYYFTGENKRFDEEDFIEGGKRLFEMGILTSNYKEIRKLKKRGEYEQYI